MIYWRLVVRHSEVSEGYLDQVTDTVLRALTA
jgi:hypothetical protein